MRKNYDISNYDDLYLQRDMMTDRTILHSDLNNFFASVEAVKHPALLNVPFAVCGDEKQRHGIVLAKNEIAKRYNIKTGETIASAKKKCPYLTTVGADYNDYVKYSRMVRRIYLLFATRVEPFGIDEAWIDVSDLCRRNTTGYEIARSIKDKVKEELGLTVSIGVSFNKTFAKLASDMKKPNAITEIPYDSFKEKLWHLPPSELLFVGKSTVARLKELKLETVGDIAIQKRSFLETVLGKNGGNLWDIANGYDPSPVSFYFNDYRTKSISNSTTLPSDVLGAQNALPIIFSLCEKVCRELRERRTKAYTISLYIKYNNFTPLKRQCRMSAPTNSTNEIFNQVKTLFLNNVNPQKPIRSVGMGVEELEECTYEQESVFEPTRLDLEIDRLRERFGDGVIMRGDVMKSADFLPHNLSHPAFNSNI